MQEGSEHFKALNEIQGITAHDKEYEIAFLADDILLSLSETQASIQCLGKSERLTILFWVLFVCINMTKTEAMPPGTSPAKSLLIFHANSP